MKIEKMKKSPSQTAKGKIRARQARRDAKGRFVKGNPADGILPDVRPGSNNVKITDER
jgi:hypothetical protein